MVSVYFRFCSRIKLTYDVAFSARSTSPDRVDAADHVAPQNENDGREEEADCSTAKVVACTALCVALAAATTTTSVDHRFWAISLVIPILGLAQVAHNDMAAFRAGWHKSRELADSATCLAAASARAEGAAATMAEPAVVPRAARRAEEGVGEGMTAGTEGATRGTVAVAEAPERLPTAAAPERLPAAVAEVPGFPVIVEEVRGVHEARTIVNNSSAATDMDAAAICSFAAAWMEYSCLEDSGAREHRSRVTRCRFLEQGRLAALAEQQRKDELHRSELRRLESGLHESYEGRLRALRQEAEAASTQCGVVQSGNEAAQAQRALLEAQTQERLQEIKGRYAQEAALRVAAEAAAEARVAAAEQAAEAARAAFREVMRKVKDAEMSVNNAQGRTCQEVLARARAEERASAAETREKKLMEDIELQATTKGVADRAANDATCQPGDAASASDMPRCSDEVTHWRTRCEEQSELRQGVEKRLEELSEKLVSTQKRLKETTQEVKRANAAKVREHDRACEAIATMDRVKLEQEEKTVTMGRRAAMEKNARITAETNIKEVQKERDEERRRGVEAKCEIEAGSKRLQTQQAILESERAATMESQRKLQLEKDDAVARFLEQKSATTQAQRVVTHLEKERVYEQHAVAAVMRTKKEESSVSAAQVAKRAGKSDERSLELRARYDDLRRKYECLRRSSTTEEERHTTRFRDLDKQHQILKSKFNVTESRLVEESQKKEDLAKKQANQSKFLIEMKNICRKANTEKNKVDKARETDQKRAKADLTAIKEAYEGRLVKALRRAQDQSQAFDAKQGKLKARLDAEYVARAEAEHRAAQALESLAKIKTKKRVGREVGTMTLEQRPADNGSRNLFPPSPLVIEISPARPRETGTLICSVPLEDSPNDLDTNLYRQQHREGRSPGFDPHIGVITNIDGTTTTGALGNGGTHKSGQHRRPSQCGHSGCGGGDTDGRFAQEGSTTYTGADWFAAAGEPGVMTSSSGQGEAEGGNAVTSAMTRSVSTRAGDFLALLEGDSNTRERLEVCEVDISATVRLMGDAMCMGLHQTQVCTEMRICRRWIPSVFLSFSFLRCSGYCRIASPAGDDFELSSGRRLFPCVLHAFCLVTINVKQGLIATVVFYLSS